MSEFHHDDPNGNSKKWTWAQREDRMRPRDRKVRAKSKHSVVPNETIFRMDDEHGNGHGSAEEKTWLAGLMGLVTRSTQTNPNHPGMRFICCESLREHVFAGTAEILEVTPVNNTGGVPQFLEVRWRAVGEDGPGVKRFAIVFKGQSDYYAENGQNHEAWLDEWDFLAEAGLFIPAGADELKRAAKEAEANGSTLTILFCEGMHSKTGVERLLAHSDNLAGVADYERRHNTKIVTMAWLSGLPGVKKTNFELRPDDYFVALWNEWKCEWDGKIIDRVIIIPDSDNQGTIEAKALGRRLIDDYDLPSAKMCKAARVPNLKRAQIEEGWDDNDDLPLGVTPRQRLDQILDAELFEARPRVLVDPDHMFDAVNATEQALIDDGGYYERAGDIVIIGKPPTIIKNAKRGKMSDHVINEDQMERAGQRIYTQEEYGVLEAMSRCACFEKPDKKSKAQPIAPPMDIAKMLMARKGRMKLPPLRAVLNRPTIDSDGMLMMTPGYDSETGLYLDFKPSDFPTIPDNPSKDDALEALAILKGLCPDFPFVTPADKSVYLAFLLTGVARTALMAAFAFLFASPKARTGKSMLVDSGNLISSGETASVINWSQKENENEARIDTALMAGSPSIAIDNVDCIIKLARLASLLTQQNVEVRIYHTQKGKTVPSIATFSFNGNNPEITDDLAQRILKCSLNAECDRPELRTFNSINPVEQVRADRGKFVMAALTTLRAYRVAGSPKVPHMRIGGFEGWCDWVGAALVWLGEPDPCEVMEATIEEAPKRKAQKAMFSALEQAFDVGNHFSVAMIIAAAWERGKIQVPDGSGGTTTTDGPLLYPELLDAVRQVAGNGKGISNQLLGDWLTKNRNVTIGEDNKEKHTFKRKLVRLDHKVHGSATAWVLEGKPNHPTFAGDFVAD
jgi:hypothetical protein